MSDAVVTVPEEPAQGSGWFADDFPGALWVRVGGESRNWTAIVGEHWYYRSWKDLQPGQPVIPPASGDVPTPVLAPVAVPAAATVEQRTDIVSASKVVDAIEVWGESGYRVAAMCPFGGIERAVEMILLVLERDVLAPASAPRVEQIVDTVPANKAEGTVEMWTRVGFRIVSMTPVEKSKAAVGVGPFVTLVLERDVPVVRS